jgi:uncharacterized protein YqjF (DUF2071 family)
MENDARDRPVVGYQRWADLLFVHWRLSPDRLRPHVPRRLEVDTFDGDAYVSLTPFTVEDARIRGMPPLPTLTTFHETNLRTYVRQPDGTAGIYFFSLEAASAPAVLGARALRLPYFLAQMERGQRGGMKTYSSRRVGLSGTLDARWSETGELHTAAPGTLEHFLVERYVLFTLPTLGVIFRGRVRHAPWSLRPVGRLELNQTLTRAAGLGELGEPALAQWTPGVNVEFFPFERI